MYMKLGITYHIFCLKARKKFKNKKFPLKGGKLEINRYKYPMTKFKVMGVEPPRLKADYFAK